MKIKIFTLLAIILTTGTAGAQDYEYRVRAGFNFGGTSPLPLPREIRKIKGYTPTLALSIGADILRHFNDRWAIQSGLKFETKGMSTRALVKNYKIAMNISDGGATGEISGVFTGHVKTKVKNDYLTLPILAAYQLSPRWSLNGGVFMSLLIRGNFSGDAYEGYIRDGDPTGEKVQVSKASYNFSSDMRKFNWGGQVGASWRAYRQFSVCGDLTIAANSIFKNDFDAISFQMYNVYMNLGFAYTF